MSHENPLGDVRYFGMYVGTVVVRADPLGLGRVQVNVPGIYDQGSGWCLPMGMPGGGAPQRGLLFVPKMGSEVCVFFKGGDPDAPYYIPAQWAVTDAGNEAPSDALAAMAPGGGGAPEDVIALETDKWKILLDDRPGHETMRLSCKRSGDMVEFDGTVATGPGITVQASAMLYFNVAGAFVVTAASVVLNGRKLSDGSSNL